ncbi:MAG: winged helix-turn-helix domain-containing protein [Bacteroidota bacterium]
MNADERRDALVERGFTAGDWLIEPLGNRATHNGVAVQLEPKVMQVLVCMAEKPNRTVTKEAFMSKVWADTVVSDDVLARCISELRKTFGDDSRNPNYIETIRKTGYRLIAPVSLRDPVRAVAPVVQGTPVQRRSEASSISPPIVSLPYWVERRPAMLAGIVAVTTLLVVLGFALGRRGEAEVASQPPPRVLTFTSFLGEEKDPALSPDGDLVAFAWNGGEDSYDHIYVKQTSNEKPLLLTDADAQDSSPTWAPTGDRVAFIRETPEGSFGIYTSPHLGGGETLLYDLGPRRAHSIAWSPNTSVSQIAISLRQAAQGPYHLFLYSIDRDTLEQVTDPPDYSVGDLNPAFSPDGQRLAFARATVPEIQDVFVKTLVDGGPEPTPITEPTQITRDSTRIGGLDWSSDGGSLIVSSERGGASGLWRVPATGVEPEWISGAAEGKMIYSPTVARDGERLAYVEESANVNIWSTYRLRDVPEPLITSTRWDSHPDVTRGGERLAFVSRRTGSLEIWTGDSDGNNLTQVTESQGPRVSTPRWSPDGQTLAFVAWEGGSADIWVIGASGSGQRRLTDHPAEDTMPSWSRDGRFIYFASNRDETWQIYRHDLDRRVTTQVTQMGGFAAQEGPFGETLYLMRPDTTGIWSQPLPEPLPVDSVNLEQPQIASVSFRNPFRSAQDASAIPEPVDSLAVVDSTLVMPELLISEVGLTDRGNWLVTEQGIYFLQREEQEAVLYLYRFGGRPSRRLAKIRTLDSLPEDHGLTLDAEGRRIIYTRVDSREGDIFYIDRFR